MKSVTICSAAVAAYAGFARALLVTGAAEGFAKGVTGGGVTKHSLIGRYLLT